MLRAILSQILDEVSHGGLPAGCEISPYLVDLRPAFAAGFLERVLDVGEGEVDLRGDRGGDFFGFAVPASWVDGLVRVEGGEGTGYVGGGWCW